MAESQRLYLTSDRSRVVEEGDTDAGYFIGNSDSLDHAYVASYFGEEVAKMADKFAKKPATKAAAKAEDKAAVQAEDKAVKGPPENK